MLLVELFANYYLLFPLLMMYFGCVCLVKQVTALPSQNIANRQSLDQAVEKETQVESVIFGH